MEVALSLRCFGDWHGSSQIFQVSLDGSARGRPTCDLGPQVTRSALMELVAEGSAEQQRRQMRLEPGRTYTVGRGSEADFPVPWDRQVSRQQAVITCHADSIIVRRAESASNPIYFGGEEHESITIRAGDCFAVGATRFRLQSVDEVSDASPESKPLEEMTFGPQQLRNVRFRDADARIEVLSHLPEVIWGARTDDELHARLANLILSGVRHADATAIVRLTESGKAGVLHWDRRLQTAGEFRPSSRLVNEALHTRRQSVLHVWEPHHREHPDFTAVAEFDWAFCTPVLKTGSEPWGLYVAGKLDGAGTTAVTGSIHLHADVKFTELVAEVISSVQRLNRLERQQAGLRQFFAPQVLALLGENPDTDLLEPRECNVTVLFCDLRGFSQQAEESAGQLLGLLQRVSRAFEVMRDEILRHGGVPCDFQGDAALGFWGWPFERDDAPLDACRAALKIRDRFELMRRDSAHPLANFEMGIGIAHGWAVAGKIGTSEQVKVTAFGPVVNLASRLESMTKQLQVPILLDEATAEIVRQRFGPADGRVRRLARILPYGMENPLEVSELLPSESTFSSLTSEHIRQFELGVEHFIAGRWEEAYECLHGMPATDRAQDFLMMRIAQNNRIAPPGWDGVIRLATK